MWDDGVPKNTRQHSAVCLALEPVQASQWHFWDQEKAARVCDPTLSQHTQKLVERQGWDVAQGALEGLFLIPTQGYPQHQLFL